MIKFYELLAKRADVSDAYFHEYWRYVHAAQYSDSITTMLKYVQSHREPVSTAPFVDKPFEGVAEGGFASLDLALALAEDPAYTEGAAQDEPNFLAVDEMRVVIAEDRGTTTGTARPDRTDRVKLLCFLRRCAEVSRDEFERGRPGAEALSAVDGVEQVVQSCALPMPPPADDQPFDGVEEIFFADAATASNRVPAIAELVRSSEVIDFAASLALVVRQVRIF